MEGVDIPPKNGAVTRYVIEIHTTDQRLMLAWWRLCELMGRKGWAADELLQHLLEYRASGED